MKEGDWVVVIRDNYGDRNGYEMIGRSGRIRRYGPSSDPQTLCWDVKLDEPMPDNRAHLWFSTRELRVIGP